MTSVGGVRRKKRIGSVILPFQPPALTSNVKVDARLRRFELVARLSHVETE